MTLLAAKFALKRSWLWIKQYWEIILGVAVGAFLIIMLKDKAPDLSSILKELKRKQDAEADAVKKAQEKEQQAIESINQKAAIALALVEEKFEAESQALDKKKQKEIKKIVAENADDPDAITKKIAELTGFTVIVRDDE